MKKLSMILTFLVIFGSSAIGHTSEERVVFEGTFERGNTTLFERAISTKRAGHKENGKPVTQFRNFLGSSGEATLKVCNAPEAEKISSAEISINGIVVLGTSNFNQNVGCIKKPVNLDDGDNILAVLLKSKPGGKVSIEISQPDSDDTDGYPYKLNATISGETEPFKPYGGIAVSLLGDFVYVTNYVDPGTVSVIDTATNTEIDTGPITVGSLPVGISLTYDGTRAYVANSFDGTVSVIDTATNTLIDTKPSPDDDIMDPITVGGSPSGISMLHGSDRDYAYVSSLWNGKVYVIDTATNTVIDTKPSPDDDIIDPITVGGYPFGISVSPMGGRAYVTDYFFGKVYVIDTVNNILIDTDTITVGGMPWGISVTPDGARVYVAHTADLDGNGLNGWVSVIDTDPSAEEDIIAQIPVGKGPVAGISVTPDGLHAYVNNSQDGTVSVIDTATNTVIDTKPSPDDDIIDPITVGNQPKGGIAVSPNGDVVYVGNYGNDDEDGTVSVIGF
jgi:YVTN family beta-propeller protein